MAWEYRLSKTSRSIFDYATAEVRMMSRKFRPIRSTEYGLSVSQSRCYLLIQPDHDISEYYVFAEESNDNQVDGYYESLSRMGDVTDEFYDFGQVRGIPAWLAVHTDGHFFQKLDFAKTLQELTDYAFQTKTTFLLQLGSIDVNFAKLSADVSERLAVIRAPVRKTRTVEGRTETYDAPHDERNRDLDRYGDSLLADMDGGVSDYVVIWAFKNGGRPSVNLSGKASVSWVEITGDVVSKNVTASNKTRRFFKRLAGRRETDKGIHDLIFTDGEVSNLVSFAARRNIAKESARYLSGRKNLPIFLGNGPMSLNQKNVESSPKIDTNNTARPESLESVGY